MACTACCQAVARRKNARLPRCRSADRAKSTASMVPAAVIIVAVANMAATTSAVGVRYLAHHMARWAAGDLASPGFATPEAAYPSDLSGLSGLGEIACGPGFRHSAGANFAMKSRPLWRARSG